MKKLLFGALLIAGLFLMVGCGGNDCNQETITAASNKISTAASTYGADPTTDNCNAYKAALNEYIDDLDGCEGVSSESIASFKQSVEDLEC